jgi:threonylcarbamoyladenosine tRNA methylthiotransferase MtaB
MARRVGFAKIHVFTYSPRQGTAAADMAGAVNSRKTKERSQILDALSVELGIEYRSRFLGQAAAVLIESDDPKPAGRAERYFNVTIDAAPGDLKKSEIVEVKLVENHAEGMAGRCIDEG